MAEDRDLIDVTARLLAALDGAYGKLRAVDALRLAGFERRTDLRSRIVSRALLRLGWDGGRYRFNGVLETAFRRGTALEREIILDVERGDDGKLVVKAKEP